MEGRGCIADAIIETMKRPTQLINAENGADLAFAGVVLLTYFATFSNLSVTSALEIVILIWLGTAYITIGIYGFAYVRKHPSPTLKSAYFILQTIIGGLIVYLCKGAGFTSLILLPLAAHSVMILPNAWLLSGNLLLMATYILSSWRFQGLSGTLAAIPIFLVEQLFIVIFTQMAINESKNRQEVEKLVNELATANQHLKDYALQVEELTLTRERNRFAREIHDGLGHYLTTINMQIQAASALVEKSPNSAISLLKSAQKQSQEALVDVRNSVSALRILPGESLPLDERIRVQVQNLNDSAMNIHYEVRGTAFPMSDSITWTLYRAVQESLNNVQKHARADRVDVLLDYSSEKQVVLEVRDDGIGVDSQLSSNGFGLIGMQERVHLLNGSCEINSQPGEGFRVRIQIPVGKEL